MAIIPDKDEDIRLILASLLKLIDRFINVYCSTPRESIINVNDNTLVNIISEGSLKNLDIQGAVDHNNINETIPQKILK